MPIKRNMEILWKKQITKCRSAGKPDSNRTKNRSWSRKPQLPKTGLYRCVHLLPKQVVPCPISEWRACSLTCVESEMREWSGSCLRHPGKLTSHPGPEEKIWWSVKSSAAHLSSLMFWLVGDLLCYVFRMTGSRYISSEDGDRIIQLYQTL